jgi:hypothetical protein
MRHMEGLIPIGLLHCTNKLYKAVEVSLFKKLRGQPQEGQCAHEWDNVLHLQQGQSHVSAPTKGLY